MVHPRQNRVQVANQPGRPIAHQAAQGVQIHTRLLGAREHLSPGLRRLFSGHHDRRPDHPGHVVHQHQHDPLGATPQHGPQPIAAHLPRRRHPRKLIRDAGRGRLTGRIQPALHRALLQPGAGLLVGCPIERTPEQPPPIMIDVGPQQRRGPAQRGAAKLPIVDGCPMHLAGIPTPPDTQG